MSSAGKLALWTIATAVFLFSVHHAWQYGTLTNGFDFYEKWKVGQGLGRPPDGILYSPKYLDFHVSSPFLYTLVSFFSSGDYALDLRMYRLVCLTSSVLAIIGLSRLLRYPLWAGMIAVFIFTFQFQPFLSDVRVANVNQIQLGLLVFFLFIQSRQKLRGRAFLGGLLLGLAVLAKANLVFTLFLLVTSWIISWQLKKALLFVSGVVAAVAIALASSGAAFGSLSYWLDWLRILPKASDYRYSVQAANYAPAMLFFSWFGIRISSWLALMLSGAAVAAFVAGVKRKGWAASSGPESEFHEDVLMTSLGCVVYLLSGSLVWLHYYFLTIPLILFLFRPTGADGRHRVYFRKTHYALAGAAVILVAEVPIRFFFPSLTPRWDAVVVNTGAAVLYGLALWELLHLKAVSSAAKGPASGAVNLSTSSPL